MNGFLKIIEINAKYKKRCRDRGGKNDFPSGFSAKGVFKNFDMNNKIK